MNENLKQSVDLFIENQNAVINKFAWFGADKDAVCALEYSAKGMSVDVEKIKEATEIINKKVNLLSDFTGPTYLMLATQMSQADQMETYFDNVQEVYNLLMKGKWISSSHFIVAAMMIVQHTNGDMGKANEYVKKVWSIFSNMQKNHPWITTYEDMGFATLLAVSGLEEEAVIDEMEKCFKHLKNAKIGSDNGIQSLSHLLSLSIGNTEQKCERVIALNDALKAQNKKLGNSLELSILGGLAFTNADIQTIAKDIVEVDEYLKSEKAVVGALDFGGQQRLLYASILVMQQYSVKETSEELTAVASMISVVIATQIAMLMIMNTNLMLMNAMH